MRRRGSRGKPWGPGPRRPGAGPAGTPVLPSGAASGWRQPWGSGGDQRRSGVDEGPCVMGNGVKERGRKIPEGRRAARWAVAEAGRVEVAVSVRGRPRDHVQGARRGAHVEPGRHRPHGGRHRPSVSTGPGTVTLGSDPGAGPAVPPASDSAPHSGFWKLAGPGPGGAGSWFSRRRGAPWQRARGASVGRRAPGQESPEPAPER